MRITAAEKEATRERIIESAAELFRTRGFDATTTRDIAQAADIAAGTLFNYFESKEAIVGALAEEAVRKARASFRKQTRRDGAAIRPSALAGEGGERSEPDERAAEKGDSWTPPPHPNPLPRGERGQERTLEEELFALVAAELRQLKPLRRFLMPLLETVLGPLAAARASGTDGSFRREHLELVVQIARKHGVAELSAELLQIYWALYTGALAFWASDESAKQQSTLALLDQSLHMFSTWLRASTSTE